MWVNDVLDTIYTIVEKRATDNLINDYPDIVFTQDEENNIQTNFPTVFIKWMPSKEVGQVLEGDVISGLACNVTIDVTVSQEQGQTVGRDVIWEVISQFKKEKFELTFSPEFLATGNSTKRVVARMKRTIGEGDYKNV